MATEGSIKILGGLAGNAGSKYGIDKLNQLNPGQKTYNFLANKGMSKNNIGRTFGAIKGLNGTGKFALRGAQLYSRILVIDGTIQTVGSLAGYDTGHSPSLDLTVKGLEGCKIAYDFTRVKMTENSRPFINQAQKDQQIRYGLMEVVPSGALLTHDIWNNSFLTKHRSFLNNKFTSGGSLPFKWARRTVLVAVLADGSIRLVGAVNGEELGTIPLVELGMYVYKGEDGKYRIGEKSVPILSEENLNTDQEVNEFLLQELGGMEELPLVDVTQRCDNDRGFSNLEESNDSNRDSIKEKEEKIESENTEANSTKSN